MHYRVALRADAAARLTGKTAAGDNVFRSRATPVPVEKLPAIVIFTPSDEGVRIGDAEPAFRQTLTMAFEVLAAETDDDDVLDGLCEKIETLLLQDGSWVAQFEQIAGITTDIGQRDEGDRVLAAAVITIQVVFVNSFRPLMDDDDLKTMAVDWDLASPDGQIEASDLLENLNA